MIVKKPSPLLLCAVAALLLAAPSAFAAPEKDTAPKATKPPTFAEMKPKAESGDATAQYYVGMTYLQGAEGMKQDFIEAAKWLTKAADQNNADAQHDLGVMYALGEGVKQDYAEAAKWYKKAADQDHPDAQYSLATLYEKGQGVKQSYAEAAKYYGRAATTWRGILRRVAEARTKAPEEKQ